MKKINILFLLILTVLIKFYSQEDDIYGIIGTVNTNGQTSPYVIRKNGKEIPIKENMVLYVGDTVLTEKNQNLEFLIKKSQEKECCLLKLAENSNLHIISFNEENKHLALNLISGKLRGVFKKTYNVETILINTTACRAEIKEGDFAINYEYDKEEQRQHGQVLLFAGQGSVNQIISEKMVGEQVFMKNNKIVFDNRFIGLAVDIEDDDLLTWGKSMLFANPKKAPAIPVLESLSNKILQEWKSQQLAELSKKNEKTEQKKKIEFELIW